MQQLRNLCLSQPDCLVLDAYFKTRGIYLQADKVQFRSLASQMFSNYDRLSKQVDFQVFITANNLIP